jgi:hypothetical protein
MHLETIIYAIINIPHSVAGTGLVDKSALCLTDVYGAKWSDYP